MCHLIPVWLDIHCPLVSVTVLLPLLPEVFAHIPVHDRLDDVDTLLSDTSLNQTQVRHGKICNETRF